MNAFKTLACAALRLAAGDGTPGIGLLAACGMMVLSLPAWPGAGQLDPQFGSVGTYRWSNAGSYLRTVVAAPDGGVFLVATGGQGLLRIERIAPGGAIDKAYGAGGAVTVEPGGVTFSTGGAWALPGGKLMTIALGPQLVALRLAADGTPDATFGANGLRTENASTNPCRDWPVTIRAVVPLPGGGWAVLGEMRDVWTGLEWGCGFVMKLSAEGAIDRGFGNAGFVGVFPWSFDARATPAGEIEVLGRLPMDGTERSLRVLRISADGKSQSGTNPMAPAPMAGRVAVNGQFLRDGGYVLVGGTSLARFRADHQLDASFGVGGVATIATSHGENSVGLRDVHAIADGGLLVTANTTVITGAGPAWPSAFYKVDAWGRMDERFGNGGFLRDPNVPAIPISHGVMQADGDFTFVAGQYNGASYAVRLQAAADVVEFQTGTLNHYFVSFDGAEATLIDRGQAGPGWTRTGKSFRPGGAAPVCRFYSPISNSHFYTADPAECEGVKRDPGWTYEGIGFHTTRPVNGTCAPGLQPVHRFYNNRWQQRDSNHRFVADAGVIGAMTANGWIYEGIAFCGRP